MCIASQIGWLKATARLMQLGRPSTNDPILGYDNAPAARDASGKGMSSRTLLLMRGRWPWGCRSMAVSHRFNVIFWSKAIFSNPSLGEVGKDERAKIASLRLGFDAKFRA